MSNKGFITILLAVLVVGSSIGGAFFGGLTIGKGQAEETSVASLATLQPSSPVGQTQPATQGQTLEQLRAQIQSGQVSPEEQAQLRQQFQGGFGGGGQAGGLGGRGGITGTVETIDGNKITLSTQQGTLEATLREDIVVRITSEVLLSDLTAGMRVTVSGERGEDGIFETGAITVIPEGSEEPSFGGSLTGG